VRLTGAERLAGRRKVPRARWRPLGRA